MTLKQTIFSGLKEAMLNKDEVKRSTLRLLRAAIQNEEIARLKELDDDDVVLIINRQIKQRKDSINAFKSGNRTDLVQRENAELDILLEFVPPQMTPEEITLLTRQTIHNLNASGPQDKGKVMGKLMPQVRGKADGAVVSSVVSELLGE
jgi:uncharacterized protein YqeY